MCEKVCTTNLTCHNGGVWSWSTCSCTCPSFFFGVDCSQTLCDGTADPSDCATTFQGQCATTAVRKRCRYTCGFCGSTSASNTTTISINTATTSANTATTSANTATTSANTSTTTASSRRFGITPCQSKIKCAFNIQFDPKICACPCPTGINKYDMFLFFIFFCFAFKNKKMVYVRRASMFVCVCFCVLVTD